MSHTSIFENRRERFYDWMAREGISLVMFEDTEGRRDPALRWFSGQPADALLFLSVDRRALLIPWDINLAKQYAQADALIPYSEFDRQANTALQGAAAKLKIPLGSKIEIPALTAYPAFLRYVGDMMDFDIICRDQGAGAAVEKLRAVKDDEEIKLLRTAAAITNDLIDLVEQKVRSGKIKTEFDAARLLETEARKRGCEGMGFETLAAGPDRSFSIHAFPAYTRAEFGGPGLSILDFGVKYQGYTTDVTLTFVREPVRAQEKMLILTEKAYTLALDLAKPGAEAREIAAVVDLFFTLSKKHMPHGLGHGIGLEAHEAPAIRNRKDNHWILEPGMVFTLEPGLYDPVHGGCRLENDILITAEGTEVLTKGRIIRL
ncbi:MAG: Xaa-Pro peptidase family protein [Treponema sp.]|jgi:Xaa-Pro dipeptidase|nr:Xaa-Pro peptidase family protein [Treponema sp.]